MADKTAISMLPTLGLKHAHTIEIQDGHRDYYWPFMVVKRHKADAEITLRNGNVAKFTRAVKKEWGGWGLFYNV